MGMLDRYKKKGGFSQLLQLIETSPKVKQEQFLNLIASESPAWEEAIRQRVLTIDKIFSWSPEVLSEVLSRVQPLQLATVLHAMPPEEIDRLLSVFPSITKRKMMDMVGEANPSAAEKSTCVSKIIVEVRGFISQGLVKAEKIDPHLLVPDDIEEKLSHSFVSSSSSEEFAPISKKSETNKNESQNSDSSTYLQEIDFLKRKVSQLASEVNALKFENNQLKDKLAQIRKIA